MENQYIQSAVDILTPVMESAMILAGEYSKKCGRSTLTGEDLRYTLRYSARYLVGKHIGSMFPEIYEETDQDSDSDISLVDEDDEPFTRYSGDDETMNAINEAHDTWDQWKPESPAEQMLKDAIDKNVNSD
jgi:hypothetical protein